jgi:hypothetical protein
VQSKNENEQSLSFLLSELFQIFMPNTTEHYVTREELEIALTRLENKLDARFNTLEQRFLGIDARFNGIDARFNAQRTLLWGIALGVLAQIVNAWIVHLK